MVISNMVIFSDIRKYGNMPYGNVFRNYYHISTSKYGNKKNLCSGGLWRALEDYGGLWRTLEGSKGLWRTLEGTRGLWRALEGSGGL